MSVDPAKIVDWFRAEVGLVTYSMSRRQMLAAGQSGYSDCSAAVTSAVINAGGSNQGLFSTVTLEGYLSNLGANKVFYNSVASNGDQYVWPMNPSAFNAQVGDIIIMGAGSTPATSGGANGHTGVMQDSTTFVSCDVSKGYNSADDLGTAGQAINGYPLIQYTGDVFGFWEVWRFHSTGSIEVTGKLDGQGNAIVSWIVQNVLGATKAGIAAVLGNWEIESTLSCSAIQSDLAYDETLAMDPNVSGYAFGVGQWDADRRVNLLNYASSQGTSWTDLATQMKFATTQEGSDSQILINILTSSSTDVAGLALLFAQEWERCAPGSYAERQAAAVKIYGELGESGNGTPAKSGKPDTSKAKTGDPKDPCFGMGLTGLALYLKKQELYKKGLQRGLQ